MAALILSLGHANRIMTTQITYQVLRLIAIWYGAQQSLLAIATNLVTVEFIGFFIFYSMLKDTNISFFDIVNIVFKNTYILTLVIFPTFITYIATINFFIIKDALINEHTIQTAQLLFIPESDSSFYNFKLVLITSAIAFVSWLLAISLNQKELWIEIKIFLHSLKNRRHKYDKKTSNQRDI
ncbi:membrane protein of unknown function [Methylotuvimicrobium alcaliphilum 20Z]|uniref:Uncharacterized protein n=1 Tax=Methylotuvimicrobium alcaliphilum (strain DSM 19304 / NCIMB 14124 / VKM B-2133 / 20Z) TaxID=1091494 RepID=G4SYV3_META2|nr:membrane protein of unknown function [Methylotuvimicrobium alcaliphilum 20Z]